MNHTIEARPVPARAAARVPVQLQSKVFDLVAGGIDTMRALLDELPEQSPALIARAVEQLVREELLHRDGARICRPGPSRPEAVAPPAREPPRPARPTPPPTPAPAPVERLTGAEVARRRAARGWSQADLARRLARELGATRGTAATYLSQLERGVWRLDDDTERARTWRPLLEQLLDPSADKPTTPHDDPAPAPAPAAPEAPTSGPSSPPARRPGEGEPPAGASEGAPPSTEDLEPDPGPAEVATDPGGPIPPAPSALVSRPPPPASPAALGQARTPPPVAIAAEGTEVGGLASTSPPPSPDEPVTATAAGDVLEPSQPGPVGPRGEEVVHAGVQGVARAAAREADRPGGSPPEGGGVEPVGAQRAAPERAQPAAAPGPRAAAPAPEGAGEVARGWSTLSLPSQRARVEQGAPPGSPPAPAQLDAADELAVLRATLADALGMSGPDDCLTAGVRDIRQGRDEAEALLAAERQRREVLERLIDSGLPADLRRDLATASAEAKAGALVGLARGGR